MEQDDAIEFYDEVIGGDDDYKITPEEQRVLEARSGHQLTVDLVKVDRKEIIDELRKLPDELLEMFDGAEDPEEVQEEATAANALQGLSGDAIEAFENICAKGMEHPELTQHQFDKLVHELSLEVLFEMGSVIIDISLQDNGKITGFRELD